MANSKPKPGNRKPISSHPLFPAVVALWFGALFGLGSLAIRPTLIESLVLQTGIDLIVPAAAPPLGITARILIALVMASLGAALGATLAVHISRPKIVVRARKRNAANPGAAAMGEFGSWNKRDVVTDGPARRPISAHEELGDALDSTGPLASRRRTLAVEHEDKPFEPAEIAPLPGGEPQIFNIAATHLAVTEVEAGQGDDHAPLDLGAFVAPEPASAAALAPVATSQPQQALDWSVPPVAAAQHFTAPSRQFPMPAENETPQVFGMMAQNIQAFDEFAPAASFGTAVFEASPAQPTGQTVGPAMSMSETNVSPEQATMAQPLAAESVPPQPSPAGLGMTDLAQRLQESMARRRAAKVKAAAVEVSAAELPATQLAPNEPVLSAGDEPAFVPPPRIDIFAAAASEHPVEPFGRTQAPIAMPSALRPIPLDPTEGDEDSADLVPLMPRHLALPQTAPFAPVDATVTPLQPEGIAGSADEEAAEEAMPAEAAFASLLSLETPRQEFVRIEEPDKLPSAVEPVVIFPGQMAAVQPAARPFDAAAITVVAGSIAPPPAAAAIDPAETELALRSALANLQRISGAA